MKLKHLILGVAAVVTLGACSKKFDSLLQNPNNPLPEQANPDLYLTQIQLSFAGMFENGSGFGMDVTRMTAWGGPTYAQGYSPESFNGLWSQAYTGVVKHANALIPIATNAKKFTHIAIAKTLKAYAMMTMVDFFGDVPYSESDLGLENTNPKVDKGADVYAKAIALLQEAKADFAKPNATSGSYPGSNDLFFGTTLGTSHAASTGIQRWTTVVNSLLLRAYVNTRLVNSASKTEIDKLIAEGNLNTSSTSDFEFKYGAKNANPDSRHPRYGSNYNADGTANDYLGTWFLFALAQERGGFNNTPARDNSDPRTRYYFYRQRATFDDVNQNSASCFGSSAPSHYPAGMPYCLIQAPGFWGRDHGDNSGVPPDDFLRTTWGVYPAGGQFDANDNASVALVRGARGAGISPIWQSSFTDFARAEAALTLGTAGDPKVLMESGVRKSIAKVLGYPATVGYTIAAGAIPTQTKIDDYVTKVLAAYDAATTNDAKLQVIMREWLVALWGNGVDAYNNYRRTGKPSGMQLPNVAAAGEFTRSMFYPASHVNLNLNAAQKSGVGVKVFWDTNPAGFIK